MNPTQKIADIYKRMRLDEAKKKMDPVGDADADIDNDGDVDDSDEYLHKRRKAIKKSMKEAEEKCPECGKVHEGECEDMEEAMEIDPDDGETKKVTGKEKKKKGQETETSVEEAALTVGMKQPVKVDDTVEKGKGDAVAAGKAGPGKAKENKAKKLKELRK
jgi:hypothetical protein